MHRVARFLPRLVFLFVCLAPLGGKTMPAAAAATPPAGSAVRVAPPGPRAATQKDVREGYGAHAVRLAQTGAAATFQTAAAARQDVASAEDLCAPCDYSAQCTSGICATATDSNGDAFGLCMQPCASNNACPTDFLCIQSNDTVPVKMCYPTTASACPSPYRGAKNTLCYQEASSDDPNTGVDRTCAGGLTCYHFPSGTGVCVTECSSINAAASCAAGETCCFDTASDGSCVTTGTATVSTGGCFVVGDVGSGCAQPDHSYCVKGASCAYTQVAASAACYTNCDSSACTVGGYCVAVGADGNAVNVCCDVRTLNLNDLLTCEPQQGLCRRELGVSCSVNAECLLGLCQKYGTQSACSVACTSDDDCPGTDADANGDGIADGGGQCLDMNGITRCWPRQGPITPPACATAQAVTGVARQSCRCSGGQDAAGAAAALAALAWRRRRRGR